jgi:hypothetical protein
LLISLVGIGTRTRGLRAPEKHVATELQSPLHLGACQREVM